MPYIFQKKKRSDSLLCKMLPSNTVDQLKRGERGRIDSFNHITIFFSSIVNFDDFVEKLNAPQLITFLNNVFNKFDGIIASYDAYKVETIGDICVITSGK